MVSYLSLGLEPGSERSLQFIIGPVCRFRGPSKTPDNVRFDPAFTQLCLKKFRIKSLFEDILSPVILVVCGPKWDELRRRARKIGDEKKAAKRLARSSASKAAACNDESIGLSLEAQATGKYQTYYYVVSFRPFRNS